jgi:hypothetical protein
MYSDIEFFEGIKTLNEESADIQDLIWEDTNEDGKSVLEDTLSINIEDQLTTRDSNYVESTLDVVTPKTENVSSTK